MGNYRFRLSDMIRPNAWFHKKHKDTTTCTDSKQKTTDTPSPSKSSSLALAVPNQYPNNTTDQQPYLSDPRKSYHFTHLHQNSQVIKPKFPVEPPRKSSRRRRSTKKNRTNVVASCSCRATLKAPDSTPEQYRNSCPDQISSSELESMLNEYCSEQCTLTPDTFKFNSMLSCSTTSCNCRNVLNRHSLHGIDNETGQFYQTGPELAPIITTKNHNKKTNVQRTSSSSSPGFKMRTNSPRIANRRAQGGRKSAVGSSHVYASFAVVKSSRDPRRDFRESMVEMIVENNIMGSPKDLEQLLACYLSLNSDEYHDIIISVFKQIWVDFIHVSTK